MSEVLIHPTAGLESKPDFSSYRAPTPEGLRVWLPALVVLVGMPLLALLTTKYVVIPPMQRVFHASAQSAPADNSVAVVSLKKTTAYKADYHALNSNILLVLSNGALKSEVVNNQDKLSALAAGAINNEGSHLDGPAAKAAFRTQLMADLNAALGSAVIRELYIAGWPTQ